MYPEQSLSGSPQDNIIPGRDTLCSRTAFSPAPPKPCGILGKPLFMNAKPADLSLAPESLPPAPEGLFIKYVTESLGMGMGALVGGPRRRGGSKLLSALRPAPPRARVSPPRLDSRTGFPRRHFGESGKE